MVLNRYEISGEKEIVINHLSKYKIKFPSLHTENQNWKLEFGSEPISYLRPTLENWHPFWLFDD